ADGTRTPSEIRAGRRASRGRISGAILTFVASTVLGCFPYEAQIQREVERGDVRVRMETADALRHKSVELRLVVESIPPDVVLMGAAASGEPEASCGEGVQAVKLGRDRARSVDAPLVRGERIALEFTSYALGELSGLSPRLDLLVRTSLKN